MNLKISETIALLIYVIAILLLIVGLLSIMVLMIYGLFWAYKTIVVTAWNILF